VQDGGAERVERDRVAVVAVDVGLLDHHRLPSLAAQHRRQAKSSNATANDQNAHPGG
jgi:hypothetical protein